MAIHQPAAASPMIGRMWRSRYSCARHPVPARVAGQRRQLKIEKGLDIQIAGLVVVVELKILAS